MKRVLYGTTALVAAGLLVTSVSYAGDEEMMEEEMMAGPVSASVGGYYRVAFGGYSGDGDDGRGHYINQNIEINVAGSTTLDNGITAGVNIWLDAMNGNNSWGDDISETRLYLSGTFGTLTLGSFESAAQLGTIWAPGGNGNFGIKSPFFAAGSRVTWTSRLMARQRIRSRSVTIRRPSMASRSAPAMNLTITRLLTVVAAPRMLGRSPK